MYGGLVVYIVNVLFIFLCQTSYMPSIVNRVQCAYALYMASLLPVYRDVVEGWRMGLTYMLPLPSPAYLLLWDTIITPTTIFLPHTWVV